MERKIRYIYDQQHKVVLLEAGDVIKTLSRGVQKFEKLKAIRDDLAKFVETIKQAEEHRRSN